MADPTFSRDENLVNVISRMTRKTVNLNFGFGAMEAIISYGISV